MAKKQKNRRRSIFVDDALWESLRKRGQMIDRKPASIIREAIRAYLSPD